MKVSYLPVLFIAIIILISPRADAIRAGADYSFIAYENETANSVTCDFCGYDYKTHPIRLYTVAVSLIQGSIDVFFLPLDDKDINNADRWKKINQGEPLTNDLPEIEVSVWQKVRLKINQTAKLKGTDLKFKLINTVGYDPQKAKEKPENKTTNAKKVKKIY